MSDTKLFEDGVHWDVVRLSGERADLLPEELPAVERAVPKRVREFAAGRSLARRMLEAAGAGRPPLPRGADRGPVWPPGFVGTISHSERWCLAAVARATAWRSLGADVEERTPLEEKLWDLVLLPSERAWIEARPVERRGLLAKLVFSAKESAYKCQAPLTGQLLEFTDVELIIEEHGDAGTFDVRWLVPEVASAVPALTGVWQLPRECILSAVGLRSSAPRH